MARVPVSSPCARRRARAALLAAAAAVLLSAAAAVAPRAADAAPELQTGISDDGVLLFDPDHAPEAVARWAAAGIDTVRIQVRWVGVAPNKLDPAAPIG